jgi:hypothetical protein
MKRLSLVLAILVLSQQPNSQTRFATHAGAETAQRYTVSALDAPLAYCGSHPSQELGVGSWELGVEL